MKAISFKIFLLSAIFFLLQGNLASAELNKNSWSTALDSGAEVGKTEGAYNKGDASLSTSLKIAEYVGKILIIAPFLGMVFLIRMVWAGYLWMTARGNSQQVEDAKKTITHALIGVIIFAVIYILAQFMIDRLAEISGYQGTAQE